jgi:predicted site-specific integrase-resolvase
MARVDIRLDDDDKARLLDEAHAEGRSLSELARDRLLGRVSEAQRLDDMDRRVTRLEGMAGMDG